MDNHLTGLRHLVEWNAAKDLRERSLDRAICGIEKRSHVILPEQIEAREGSPARWVGAEVFGRRRMVGAVAGVAFHVDQVSHERVHMLVGTFWAAITRAAMALNLISEPISNTLLDE